MIAIAQITIRDENDISIGKAAPQSPVKDQMWLDTSSNPSVLKRYNGKDWDVVNDVQIGGRNLALNTAPKVYSGFTGRVNDCQMGYEILLSTLNIGDFVTISYVFNYKNLIPTSGHTDYGIWLQGCGDITEWSTGALVGGERITSKIEWGNNHSGEFKIEYTFKVTYDMKKNNKWLTSFRMDYIQSGEVGVKYFKAEKGNKATDYTPAPEDVDNQINDVKKITETNSTNIKVQENKINASIENSKIIEANQKSLEDRYNRTVIDVNSVKNTIGQHKTLIDTATGKITGVEVKTNTLEKNLTGLTSTLQQTNKTISDNKTLLETKTNELKQDINGLSSNISNIQKTTDGKISTLNATTSNLQAGINGVSSKLSSVEETTKNINNVLNNKENKNDKVIYAKGTGNDYPSNAIVKVGNSVITNGHGRGLQIVALNSKTLTQEFKQDYDTYIGGQPITDFVNKINSLNEEDRIIIITSFDSSSLSNALICEALYKIGGYSPKSNIQSYREAYALIGKSKLGKSNGIEMYIPKTANDKRCAEVSVKVGEDGTFLGYNNIGFGKIIDETNANVTQLTNKTTLHDTEIKAIKGEVSSKVSESTLSNTVKTINDNIKIATDKANENATQIKQTKDSLTANVSSLTSKTETIKGNISSLNNDLVGKINTSLNNAKSYADNTKNQAISSANSYTNTAKADAIKQANNNTDNRIKDIHIGGENLISKSNIVIKNNAYNICNFEVPSLKPNTKYTVTFKANIPENKQFGIWFNGGASGGFRTERKNGDYVYSIVVTTPPTLINNLINFYNYPSSIVKDGIFYWATMFEGDVKPPLTYVSAPEDIRNEIKDTQKSITDTTNKLNQAEVDLKKYSDNVAIAKSNLATEQAKAYADGQVSKEEQARIKQANDNLNNAINKVNQAKSETQKYAEKIADDKYNLAKSYTEEVSNKKYDLSIEQSKAYADGKITTEEKKRIQQAQENLNTAIARADKAKTDAQVYSDNLGKQLKANAEKYANDVAIAKSELARTQSQAYADGRITNEEKARISQAQANLNTAIAKSNEAESKAKTYADVKKQEAINSASSDATNKSNNALKNAKDFTNAQITVTNNNLNKTTSEINVLKGQINTKVGQTDVDRSINDISFSKANLILNSGNFKDTSYWINNGGVPKIEIKEGFNCLKSTGSIRHEEIKLEHDTYYIYWCEIMFSSDVDINTVTPLHHWCNGKGKAGDSAVYGGYQLIEGNGVAKANEWHKIVLRFKTESKNNFPEDIYLTPFIYKYPMPETYWIKYISLSEGNKCIGGWTPNPLDVDKTIVDNIKVVTDKISDVSSKLTQTKDSLQASVNSLNSSTQTITTNLTNTTNSLSNKINTAKTDAINSSKSYADSKKSEAINDSKGYVNGQISTVNTNLNNVKSKTDLLSRGLNKWIFKAFDKGSLLNTQSPDIGMIIGKTLLWNREISDSEMTSYKDFGSNYIGYCKTNVYLDSTYTWNTSLRTDDAGSVYLNGALIDKTSSCTPKNIVMSFKQGWNTIEVLWVECGGGDGFNFGSNISTLSQIKIMNAYDIADNGANIGYLNTDMTNKYNSSVSHANSIAEQKKNEAITSANSHADSVATSKANSAQSNAISHADSVATSKSNEAKNQAISSANSYTNTAKQQAIDSANSHSNSVAEQKKNEAITGARTIPDTRNDNQNPDWYMKHYPHQTITEFKLANIIKIPNGSSVYGTLETKVPWGDSSGGYPTQVFRSNSYPTYQRHGLNTTAWSNWEQIEDTKGSQSKADSALNNAKTYTNVQISTVNTRVSNAESSINVLKGQISSKVSQSDIDKTVNSIQIGGRNLALNTSLDFTSPYSLFNGGENTCPSLGKVTTKGLKVGDKITVRLVYSYNNIIPTEGKQAQCWLQGSGNATGWSTGAFYGSPRKTIKGTGEIEILYSCDITSEHIKNTFWDTNIRHDYVKSGSVKWKEFKVEKGNKATDWTPAPEDVNQEIKDNITTVTTKINTVESSLNQTKNSLTASVQAVDVKANNINNSLNSTKNDLLNKVNAAIDTSKKYSDQVAVAKSNLAKQEAIANADGKINSEEKARIKQAQDNLNNAISKANSAKTEAINLSKQYSDTQLNNAKNYTNSQVASAKSQITVDLNGIKTEVSKKVNSGNIMSTINQSAESVKINANKIQLNGCTAIGNSDGRFVRINNANYTIRDNKKEYAYFGFQSDEKNGHPKLTLGANGLEDSQDYLTIHANPAIGSEKSYAEISYRIGNKNDYSNLKLYGTGDMKAAPLYDFAISSNCVKGVYQGQGEYEIARFSSSNDSNFDANLQIDCVRNMKAGRGLILGDFHLGGGKATCVRIQSDEDNHYFRPLNGNGDVQLGSPSFRWYKLYSKYATSVSSHRHLKTNIVKFDDDKAYERMRDMNIYTFNMKKFDENNNVIGYDNELCLGTMIDELPIECCDTGNTNFKKQGVDMYGYASYIASALKSAINKIDNLEKEVAFLKENKK